MHLYYHQDVMIDFFNYTLNNLIIISISILFNANVTSIIFSNQHLKVKTQENTTSKQ